MNFDDFVTPDGPQKGGTNGRPSNRFTSKNGLTNNHVKPRWTYLITYATTLPNQRASSLKCPLVEVNR